MRPPLFVLTLILAACGGDSDEDSATTLPTTGDTSTTATTPTTLTTPTGTKTTPTTPTTPTVPPPALAGSYTTYFDGFPIDECGTFSAGFSPAPWTLEWPAEDTFRMVEPGVDCLLDPSPSASCTDEQITIPINPYVAIDLTVSREGQVVDAETIELTLSFVADCSGEDCDGFAAHLGTTFPCRFAIDTTSVWQGPAPARADWSRRGFDYATAVARP